MTTSVKYNPTTNKWDIHKKEMFYIGRLDWVIHKTGFDTKQDAESWLFINQKVEKDES